MIDHTEHIADMLKALGHPIRLRILLLLMKEGPLVVKDIWQHMVLPQPVISKHLSQLSAAGVLESSRDGMNVEYTITDDAWNLAEFLSKEIS